MVCATYMRSTQDIPRVACGICNVIKLHVRNLVVINSASHLVIVVQYNYFPGLRLQDSYSQTSLHECAFPYAREIIILNHNH